MHRLIQRRKIVDRTFDFSIERTRAFEENDERIIEGIATTPGLDRSGDTIDPLGMAFRLPLPLLWQHDAERPIGQVIEAKQTRAGITFRAKIVKAGEIPGADTHWKEIKNSLVQFLSVGFRSLVPPTPTKTGLHYSRTEWLELSCVTIPANADCAITHIKAFEIGGDISQPNDDGESAANAAPTRAKTMTLKEKIAARKARLLELRQRAQELGDGEDSDEAAQATEQVNADIEAESAALALDLRTQANIAGEAQPVQQQSQPGTSMQRSQTVQAPAILSAVARQSTASRPKAQLLFRSCAAHVVAYAHNMPVDQAAAHLYRNDEALKGYMAVQKAAVEPALTTVPAWAGDLVRDTWAEFLDLLLPQSVYAQLAAKGSKFSFNNTGRLILPSRTGAGPYLAGDFVGENAPIPVKKTSVTSQALGPKKLAVISAFSQEMSTATGGQIEGYIRDFILADTAGVLDARLLDNLPATAIRPAGLLNGVTPIASSGNTLADIITDIKAAVGPILDVNGGRNLVWLMHPLVALSLGLQTNAAGAFIFPNANESFQGYSVIVSGNVPSGTMILVDAADFATVADDTPQFRVSSEATLHMEDTTPLPINGGTPASPVISLFQQDSLAVRMIQQMNWAMRRPGMVSAINGIAW